MVIARVYAMVRKVGQMRLSRSDRGRRLSAQPQVPRASSAASRGSGSLLHWHSTARYSTAHRFPFHHAGLTRLLHLIFMFPSSSLSSNSLATRKSASSQAKRAKVLITIPQFYSPPTPPIWHPAAAAANS